MKEYIERDLVMKQLDNLYDNFNTMGVSFYQGFQVARHNVKDFPAADVVEVRHERWEFEAPDKHGNRKPICPHCKEYKLACWSDYASCNYCPNCGAMMDKEEI